MEIKIICWQHWYQSISLYIHAFETWHDYQIQLPQKIQDYCNSSYKEWLKIIKVSANINHTDFNSSLFDNFSCKASFVNYSKLYNNLYLFDILWWTFFGLHPKNWLDNFEIFKWWIISSFHIILLGLHHVCEPYFFDHIAGSNCILLLFSFHICKPMFALKY